MHHPERVAVMGYSAGGHLASLLGVVPEVRELDEPGCDASGGEMSVRAVVSCAGPQNLRVNGPYTQEQADIVTNFHHDAVRSRFVRCPDYFGARAFLSATR